MLTDHPERVDLKVLGQCEEFAEFKTHKTTVGDSSPATEAATTATTSDHTPEERLDAAFQKLRTALAAKVLDRVRERSPEFFEQLVLDVLRGMGYGGRLG